MNATQRRAYDQQERMARAMIVGLRPVPRQLAQAVVETTAGRYCVRVMHLGDRIWWEALRLDGRSAELLDEDHVPACVAAEARRLRSDWL